MSKKKKRFVSLTSKLLIVMAAALTIALAVFFACREFGNFLVWRYYLTDDAKNERVESVISDLNAYAKENELSVNDSERFAEWSGGRYVYVVLYKDSNLIYAPDWFEDFNGEESEQSSEFTSESASESVSESLSESAGEADSEILTEDESANVSEAITDEYVEDITELESDSGEAETIIEAEVESESESAKKDFNLTDKGWFSGDRGFERYLTEEAREKYRAALDTVLEGNAELSPIYCVDGTLLATVVDYSEDFMYDLVFAISLICAVLVVGFIMFINLSRLTARVKKLAAGVRLVEEGNIDAPLNMSGNDEISDLADDVNSMRDSVVDNMTKGQQAWEANAGLITAMSHDIRTPLTVMLGYLDIIELQEENETNREYITICKENALRLKALSDDMFSYFLVFGKNDIELEVIACNAADTVGGMMAEYELLLAENGYTVERNGDMPSVDVKVDVVCLGRVMGNIFSNITKYADSSRPVVVGINSDDRFLSITFENGVRRDRDSAESTGIGVKTSARIMEQMGGAFTVRQDSENYTVELRIPLKKT